MKGKKGETKPPLLKTEDPNKSCVQRLVKHGGNSILDTSHSTTDGFTSSGIGSLVDCNLDARPFQVYARVEGKNVFRTGNLAAQKQPVNREQCFFVFQRPRFEFSTTVSADQDRGRDRRLRGSCQGEHILLPARNYLKAHRLVPDNTI